MNSLSGFESRSINRQFRVLIVDDQARDLKQPYLLTKHLGCEVSLAFDGKQALLQIERQDFDLIILDWYMEVPGWAFLKMLELRFFSVKPQPRVNKIIIYSSKPLDYAEFAESEAYQLVDIWRKPIGPLDMLKRLDRVRHFKGVRV